MKIFALLHVKGIVARQVEAFYRNADISTLQDSLKSFTSVKDAMDEKNLITAAAALAAREQVGSMIARYKGKNRKMSLLIA